MKTLEIDVNEIVTNENSRVNFKTEELAELMGSIKQYGLLEPIGVHKLEDGMYETIYGNRRLEAIKKLRWPFISAIVYTNLTDIDRDLMNLEENMKRANTSTYEDGRMFDSLMARGLTKSELAAKLGISAVRVETALEVFKRIPTEFQKKVVFNRVANGKGGTVSATAAGMVLNIQKTLGLSKADTSKLLQYTSQDNSSIEHIRKIAPLIKEGYTVDAALEYAKHYKVIRMHVLMDLEVIRKLEKSTGRPILDLLHETLYSNKSFKLQKRKSNGKFSVHKKNGSRMSLAGDDTAA